MQMETLRMQAVQSPIIPLVGELIRRYPGTISLAQGVVYYDPPSEVEKQISQFFADRNNHKYQAVVGIPALQEAIAHKLPAENGMDMTGRAIVVTAGANMGFLNAVLAIASSGDEIILQTPYYFNHEMAIAIAGCRAILVSTDENYQLRPDAIRAAITDKTRAIVTISPNNPTGVVYPEVALREINQICRESGIYHISDEAYEYFTYDGVKHFSPGSITDSQDWTISLYSLSKAYGFASWRIGYMVIPEKLLLSVQKIQDTNLICAPVISQYAAVGAMQAGVQYCHHHLEAIAKGRKIALAELAKIQEFCHIPPANGAFYFLLKLHTEMPPMTVVERLVSEYKVAVLPGTTFGLEKGCYLRVAYGALPTETAAEGIGRLVQGLQAIVKN